MKYDSRLHKRRRRLLHAFGEGVGAPAGYAFLLYKDGSSNYQTLLYKDAAGTYRPLAYKKEA